MDMTLYYSPYTTQATFSNAKPTWNKKMPAYYSPAGSLLNEILVFSDSEERFEGLKNIQMHVILV